MIPTFSTIATLDDALRILRQLRRLQERFNCVLALYGSTLMRHTGEDVDVLVTPWSKEFCPEHFISYLQQLYHFHVIDWNRSSLSTGCIGIFDHVLVDFHFPETALTHHAHFDSDGTRNPA